MARQIVTQPVVEEIAEALILEGVEPSIVAVQSRIGGGSYSTVKRYLDVWKQAREKQAAATMITPPEVLAKGRDLASAVWALAVNESRRETQQEKNEAHAVVAAIRAELAEAGTVIARLETIESEQAAAIDLQQVKLREADLALAEAQAQSRRVPELERTIAELRAELDAARKEATGKAVEAGRLAGESDALRAQVREMMSALKPSSA